MTTLIGEGLLIKVRPHGTTVRDPHARPDHTDHRALSILDNQYTEPGAPQWKDLDPPTYTRADATTTHATLFDIPAGQPMLTRDVRQHAGQLRRAVRLFMPFSVAADNPWRHDPHLPTPTDVYTWYHAQGHVLTFTEYVRTRMPVGDESAALRMTPGTPLLVINRIAATKERAVTLEEIRLPGDQAELAYPLPVTTTKPANRAEPATRTRRD